jgi:hypothetical protein
VDFQILKLTNKACFREELPLESLGMKKLAASETSFAKSLQFVIANLSHTITHKVTVTTSSLSKFIQVSLSKVKVM